MNLKEENNLHKSDEEQRKAYWKNLADELERSRSEEVEKKKVYEYELQGKKDKHLDKIKKLDQVEEIGKEKTIKNKMKIELINKPEDIRVHSKDNYKDSNEDEVKINKKTVRLKKSKKIKKSRESRQYKQPKKSKKTLKEHKKPRSIDILGKIAYLELILSILAAIFVGTNSIMIGRILPFRLGGSIESYLISIGLGFTILLQGVISFLVILAIKEIADNIYDMKNKKDD